VPPERPMVTLCGSNDSDAVAVTLPVGGGVLTTSCAVPECVMLPETIVAVMVVEPLATPVATPLAGSIVAFVSSLDVHVAAGRPDIACPFWSMAVADIAMVPPGETEGDVGPTVTEVNTGVGPVLSLLLPPHANIVATTLPAAMVRIALLNMALAPREGRGVDDASLGSPINSENDSGVNGLTLVANDSNREAIGLSQHPSTRRRVPCTAALRLRAPAAAPA
jgi:hypothetical protein